MSLIFPIVKKLRKALANKADIRAALIEKGREPSNDMSTFGDEIRAIETGGGGSEQLTRFGEYSFPTELQEGSLYTFQMPNGNILISKNETNFGLWEFNATTRVFTKIFSSGYYWATFQALGNKCFISSTVSAGLLLYDSDTSTIGYTDSNYTRWNIFHIINETTCIICNSNNSSNIGFILYKNGTVTKFFPQEFFHLHTVKLQLEDKIYIFGSGYSAIRYDLTTETPSIVDCKISRIKDFILFGENEIVMVSTGYNKAFVIYNKTLDSFTIKDTSSFASNSWYYFYKFNNRLFLSGQINSDKNLIYEFETDTFTTISVTGSFRYFFDVGDDLILCRTEGTSAYRLEPSGTALIQLSTYGGFSKFVRFGTNGVLFGTSGISLYDGTAKTLTNPVQAATYTLSFAIGDKCILATSTSGKNVVLCDMTAFTVSTLVAGLYGYVTNFFVSGNLCFISGNGKTGLYVYNAIEETLVSFFTTSVWSNFIDTPSGVYASQTTTGTIFYDKSTGQAGIVAPGVVGFTDKTDTYIVGTGGGLDTETNTLLPLIQGTFYSGYLLSNKIVQEVSTEKVKLLNGYYKTFKQDYPTSIYSFGADSLLYAEVN